MQLWNWKPNSAKAAFFASSCRAITTLPDSDVRATLKLSFVRSRGSVATLKALSQPVERCSFTGLPNNPLPPQQRPQILHPLAIDAEIAAPQARR